MPTIDLEIPISGEDVTAGLHATNYQDLETLLNGLLDNANIASGAGIFVSKLAPGTNGQVLTTTGGAAAWGSVSASPAGAISAYAGFSAPTGWLLCDGSSVSRTTYADLFAAVISSKGTFTVTIASPGVFTLATHGLAVGDAVYLTTTGALPTGLSANTTYFVSVVTDANTFQLSATRGGASINTSGSQSGVHTLVLAPYGVADANNFNLPDLRGRMPVGKGTNADVDTLGDNDGSALADRRPKHKHTATSVSGNEGAGGTIANSAGNTQTVTSIQVGPQTNSPTDAPAYLVLNYIIKT